ncbi:hypothetical protein G5C51_32895 [Streptomyces sp. A7024]|uniref:Tetratricopeptide repeat protein n=1 Tax=Streptomyces coryli TaxID=1128680 RepID=A0A6G4UAF9_9ACTN|nr:hypothetical protein [Streptomyces coryli]NGN68676.1 hypothetical protein [Streptomyces coryli]
MSEPEPETHAYSLEEAAEEESARAATSAPGSPERLHHLLWAAEGNWLCGRYEESLELSERAIREYGDEAQLAAAYRIRVLDADGRREEALRAAAELKAADPQDPEVRDILARVLPEA